MPERQNIENSDLASETQVYLEFSEHEELWQSQYSLTVLNLQAQLAQNRGYLIQ